MFTRAEGGSVLVGERCQLYIPSAAAQRSSTSASQQQSAT
ncbi:unnamed protein product [Nezara viridula]|uniref:Uncharacterized protein n=1 Tax=Nezara viridula TaxID=85310 RepID=A0A9P0E7H4_NEZVI|nr:unnamed protein product [Nezara viridula]